jgi:hypothetical protein
MIKRTFFTGVLILLLTGLSHSQTYIHPNYSLKSHETLNIVKVEVRPEATLFYMSIENRISNGTFCADRNIYIIYPDGTKVKLETASGIPVCPDSYKFKAAGEKLEFLLSFPPLKSGTKWIDLIEDCQDNCFSFYGVTLDNDLNKRIDDAFALGENDESARALISFINIADGIDKNNLGIEGLIYINIIKLAMETGDEGAAESWYKKFKLSNAPRLSQYIKYLNDLGINY